MLFLSQTKCNSFTNLTNQLMLFRGSCILAEFEMSTKQGGNEYLHFRSTGKEFLQMLFGQCQNDQIF